MENTYAKLFVTSHPADLLLYKNMVMMIRSVRPCMPVLLLKVNHRYYQTFSLKVYRKYFDEVIELPFITYEKNLLRGMKELKIFKEKLKELGLYLNQFQLVDVVIAHSAWLPTNLLLSFLSTHPRINQILRWDFGNTSYAQTKRDIIKTLYCRMYGIFAKSYKVDALSTRGGKFIDFVYAQHIPGKPLHFIHPLANPSPKKAYELPYPLIRTSQSPKEKEGDIVVVFGDSDIVNFSEYFVDIQELKRKLTSCFQAIRAHHKHALIYYKPHPADNGKHMPGRENLGYYTFESGMNTQEILDSFHTRIKAVYTVHSTSVLFSSFFGIPSYTLYKFLYNDSGIKRFDKFFAKSSSTSSLIFNVSHLDEIGKIDALKKTPHYVDLAHIDKRYLRILNI